MKTTTGELVHLVVEEIWNRGELEMADQLFTDDYVNHGGLIPDLLRGPEAIKLSVALFRSAFPTFHVAVADISIDGAAVVLRWVAHSRPPFAGGSTPRRGGLRGITRCRLRAGKIAESWTVWNSRIAILEWTPRGKRRTDLPANHVDSRKTRRANRREG